MSARQALDVLARLHGEYCQILDVLIAATPANVSGVVDKEKQVAEQIWKLAPVAFGPAAGAKLYMLKPIKANEAVEINGVKPLNEKHRLALLGCCVRSRRLGKLLQETKQRANLGAISEQARKLWRELEAEQGPALPRGKARRYLEIANRLRCPFDSVKKAILREGKGTVPK